MSHYEPGTDQNVVHTGPRTSCPICPEDFHKGDHGDKAVEVLLDIVRDDSIDWTKEVLGVKTPKDKATDKQVGGSHYKDMPIQPGRFINANRIPWFEGNAIKYLCRHSRKNGRQDLEKAKHYIELALEFYYPEAE